MASTLPPLTPGATLGVFGSGQLGRMFVHAAQRLGYKVHVFSPHRHSPAGLAADVEHVGLFTDLASVERFARGVSAITLEFENVPVETIHAAERCTIVRPAASVLFTTQHRVREKNFLRDAGAPVGEFAAVGSLPELEAAAAQLGLPAVLKTAQMGYDGKGQRVLKSSAELADAWRQLGPGACILEAFVPFRRELSIIAARSATGEVALYGPIENEHANHILDVSTYPARRITRSSADAAESIARRVVEALGVVGILCIELFETCSGELLVNELAPRPHNSGHLTIEACDSSQFDQQVRTLCGLPLGNAAPRQPAAMANLLGDLWEDGEPNWQRALELPGVSLHLYGKESAKVGRKMGHLTALGETPDAARALAIEARRWLGSAR
jgi:5-(carboxyamino)imidazole ribonucleotide synthase